MDLAHGSRTDTQRQLTRVCVHPQVNGRNKWSNLGYKYKNTPTLYWPASFKGAPYNSKAYIALKVRVLPPRPLTTTRSWHSRVDPIMAFPNFQSVLIITTKKKRAAAILFCGCV